MIHICDQCGERIRSDYVEVKGMGEFCDDDCLANYLLDGIICSGDYAEVEYDERKIKFEVRL